MGYSGRKKSGKYNSGTKLVVPGQGTLMVKMENGDKISIKPNNSIIFLPSPTPSSTPPSTPTPTPTPSLTQTVTPTPSLTQTVTPTPSLTQTVTPTNTQTPTTSQTPTPTAWSFRRLISCCGGVNGKGYVPPNLTIGDTIVATNNLCYTVGTIDIDVATLVYQSTFIGDCTACNAAHPC